MAATQWLNHDGCVVCYLSVLVQLDIVSPGEIVYVIGHAR
jgi:hypothetical protein